MDGLADDDRPFKPLMLQQMLDNLSKNVYVLGLAMDSHFDELKYRDHSIDYDDFEQANFEQLYGQPHLHDEGLLSKQEYPRRGRAYGLAPIRWLRRPRQNQYRLRLEQYLRRTNELQKPKLHQPRTGKDHRQDLCHPRQQHQCLLGIRRRPFQRKIRPNLSSFPICQLSRPLKARISSQES